VVTTGGTGPARRDVTPEATEAVCQKMLPGFGELMRAVSLKAVPTAILSRQTAGVRGSSLVLNLPGKPSAIRDCLLAVMPAIPYCVDLIGGPRLETNAAVVTAFRPKT
jgi:molybdopterin adenylyltransferase